MSIKKGARGRRVQSKKTRLKWEGDVSPDATFHQGRWCVQLLHVEQLIAALA
jgi:hypothetical protein